MRGFAGLLLAALSGCLHGPVGPTWYGRGPATTPPSEPLRAPVEVARALAAGETSCRAVLEAAAAIGYAHGGSGLPCQRTRDETTPFHLALERDGDGGLRRELTFSWKADGVEGGAYIPAYPVQREGAQRRLAATAAEWNDTLSRAAQPPRAGPSDERSSEAATRFDRGVALFEDGRTQEALLEFEAAYASEPRWEVLYNIAVVQQKLTRPALAHLSFTRYLAEGGARVPAPRRAEVEKVTSSLEPLLARVTLQVVGPPAEVEVDGRPLGPNPPPVLFLEPGHHVLKARQAREVRAERACELRAGESAVVVLDVSGR